MIRFILVQNRQGKTRLSKWYVPYDDDEKVRFDHTVSDRRGLMQGGNGCAEVPEQLCRGAWLAFLPATSPLCSVPPLVFPVYPSPASAHGSCLTARQFRNYKIVYRRYAGLFFCVCVDANDNELAHLEAIHFFVEVLGPATDTFFDNVCELDLVFNFYKVYAILDEVFLAGEIEETSKDVVLARLEALEKLE
ncbi:AP complex subunit sigma [Mycena indigotica]|uniref:AP complex subunit sigma n=1 Tax=Mycena indigotica TaxID=2126181 RepID=A0A8H6S394_9AGAR|nr:AP complex subunit sigma [Mycena indigotica]KAF7291251.1 AP complex subunit sigma [Mycena indigotica]